MKAIINDVINYITKICQKRDVGDVTTMLGSNLLEITIYFKKGKKVEDKENIKTLSSTADN